MSARDNAILALQRVAMAHPDSGPHSVDMYKTAEEARMGLLKESGVNYAIEALAQKFLGWQLPKSVASDPCVCSRCNPNYEFPRSGTNLLTADEARQLMVYLLK